MNTNIQGGFQICISVPLSLYMSVFQSSCNVWVVLFGFSAGGELNYVIYIEEVENLIFFHMGVEF